LPEPVAPDDEPMAQEEPVGELERGDAGLGIRLGE
jgi:hypothetical protein